MNTLRKRLETLVANPRLKASGRDLQFAESLLAYYERTGRLTSGRRTWIDKLEAKYAADAPDMSDQTLGSRIDAVMPKTDPRSWDRGFLESLQEQNRTRGNLSARQIQILEKIEDNHSEEVIARRATWADDYNAESAERMKVAAAYYAANPPYFGDLAHSVLNVEGFVPTEKQYRSLTENKYAAKVIASHFAEATFPVGSKVEWRSSAGARYRGMKGFVMKVNAKPVTNAARGTKVYMVLPVGAAVPVFAEERHLKRGRF